MDDLCWFEIILLLSSKVSSPGDTLVDILKERGMTQLELAMRMGVPLKVINSIINVKSSITPNIATQLEIALGTPAEFWKKRESNFREYLKSTNLNKI